MTITRQMYEFATASAKTDTGPPVTGALHQMRWEQTGTADTGGDVAIYGQQREADTGNGFIAFDDNDCLGTDFQRLPRSATHTVAGLADTGDDFLEAVVFAGERPRVRVTPAGGTVSGRLYLWFKD